MKRCFLRLLRLCHVVLIERRVPIAAYKLSYGVLKLLGFRRWTVRRSGLSFQAYTDSLFMFHEIWSKHDYDLPGFALQPGMTVVDIGANQGFFSLYAASRGAAVYAFEPCNENFEMLRLNVEQNGFTHCVKLFNAAVTGMAGPVMLYVGSDGSGGVASATVSTASQNVGGKSVEVRYVESVTLDSILSNFAKCDLLKMDCEGAEYEILRSTSLESFHKIGRIVMECHENRTNEATEILRNVGFDTRCEGGGWLGIVRATNHEWTKTPLIPLQAR